MTNTAWRFMAAGPWVLGAVLYVIVVGIRVRSPSSPWRWRLGVVGFISLLVPLAISILAFAPWRILGDSLPPATASAVNVGLLAVAGFVLFPSAVRTPLLAVLFSGRNAKVLLNGDSVAWANGTLLGLGVYYLALSVFAAAVTGVFGSG